MRLGYNERPGFYKLSGGVLKYNKTKKFLKCVFLAVVLFSTARSRAADAPGDFGPRYFAHPPSEDSRILSRYLAATERQKTALLGMSTVVDIDAQLPRLKKQGKMSALRMISKVGKITYRMLGFSGDATVKKDVIARYLNAEVQAQGSSEDFGITPQNYKFKFKGLQRTEEREVYVFHVTPRHKRVGLFKGELWLDPETCMPVREQGRFVKSPSIFFKKVEFVREYAMNGDVAVPRSIESLVVTRIVGPVQFKIHFANPAKTTAEESDAASASGTE